MLEHFLEKLNISSIGASVYATLVENGPSTAGALARNIRIPRSSLYGYLETLRAKGLVRQSHNHDKKIWQAESIEMIGRLLEQDIDRLARTKEAFEQALPDLRHHHVTDYIAPSMTYFEGIAGMQQMFRDILLHYDIETVAFWSIKDAMHFLGQDFMKELSEKRIQNRISIRVIWPKGKNANMAQTPFMLPGKEYLRDIRIAPQSLTTSMGYWVYGNRVSFISSKKESFGFIVESNELANMLRTQFEVFWIMSKPIAPNETV